MQDIPKLGDLVPDGETARDAIHIAVVPLAADAKLFPGEDVGLIRPGVASRCDKPIGIVDPFLKRSVQPGERFWLLLYPGSITSLRHGWTHAAFDGEARGADHVGD